MLPRYCHGGGKQQPQTLDPQKSAHLFGDEIIGREKVNLLMA